MSLHIPTFDRGGTAVNVVVETPRGSCAKFKYNRIDRTYNIHKLLPLGSVFPFHLGFIPQTRGADGLPLDVLILLDDDLPFGCIVKAQLLGVIIAQQDDGRGRTVRNDRIIGISLLANNARFVRDISGLSSRLLSEIERFFTAYDAVEGKRFTPTGRGDSTAAANLVRASLLN